MLVNSAGGLGMVGLGGNSGLPSPKCVKMILQNNHNFLITKCSPNYVQTNPLTILIVPYVNIK